MTLSDRKKRRNKVVKENSSNFVDKFSQECFDSGMTNLGVKVFAKGKRFTENYDKIDWGST